jgi:hypothetical protein
VVKRELEYSTSQFLSFPASDLKRRRGKSRREAGEVVRRGGIDRGDPCQVRKSEVEAVDVGEVAVLRVRLRRREVKRWGGGDGSHCPGRCHPRHLFSLP